MESNVTFENVITLIQHEHPLHLVDLQPCYPDYREFSDDEEEDKVIKWDFKSPYGNLFCPTPASYVWSPGDIISVTAATFPVKYRTVWAADASWSTPTNDVHAHLSPGKKVNLFPTSMNVG
nr:polyadenylate-binding protein-interacting protein 3 [Tanacetum cinerariifolium]